LIHLVITTQRGKYLAAAAIALLAAVMYLLPQHLHLGIPARLPLTRLDREMPFCPLSGLIYFAIFPFLLVTFGLLQDFAQATRFLRACRCRSTVCGGAAP
jgi:hypothetical protein